MPSPQAELPLTGELEPVPVDSCDVCAALGKQREEARRAGDMTAVTDCNVELRRHPRQAKQRR
ncbi:hypothetical protein P8605_06170 [Streptomyces sp. T-3]|nr:hypothetical protein [Streptomyces sp. T-3]